MALSFSHGGVSLRFGSSLSVLDAHCAEQLVDLGPERAGAVFEDAPIPALGPGRVETQVFRGGDLELRRELFRPADPAWLAVRLIVTHRGQAPIELEAMDPLRLGPGDIDLAGTPGAELRVMRQPRYKNDIPSVLRLGDTAPRAVDAFVGSAEAGGTHDTRLEALPTVVHSAEATVLFDAQRALLFGFAPVYTHLVATAIEMTPGRDRIHSIVCRCHCDGQVLAPGSTVVGPWLLLHVTDDASTALAAYANVVASVQTGRGRRPHPPSVWCSWYYYGRGFTVAEARREIQAIVRRRLPVEVFQIDDAWEANWGDQAPLHTWGEIATLAGEIRSAGMEPGIWTAPLLAEPHSVLAMHRRDLLLRDRKGALLRFNMNDMNNYVLDPSHPEVLALLEARYRHLTLTWGYTYHKIDFCRAPVIVDRHPRLHNPSMNRAQALRGALEAIRRGIGENSYLDVCGGIYGVALGIADAQRSGSDVHGSWPRPGAGAEEDGIAPVAIKQNILRNWMSRLWDTDADALMVRRRTIAHRDEWLSLGRLSDDQALTATLNQFLGGGMVCVCEAVDEIEADRLALWRHIIPSLGCPGVPQDAEGRHRYPSLCASDIRPRAAALGSWRVLSLVNWFPEPRDRHLRLDARAIGGGIAPGTPLLVSAFRAGWTRVLRAGEELVLPQQPPFACELLRIQRPGCLPTVTATDGHFSMGGSELTAWDVTPDGDVLAGIEWPWAVPLHVRVAWPSAGAELHLQTITIDPHTCGTMRFQRPGSRSLRNECLAWTLVAQQQEGE
jgi:hypothetical protein